MQGYLLINKPTAVTSFHVTACVRKKLGIKRTGHAGTLDPLATGVLPVMVGQATRLIELLPVSEKRYKARFQTGLTTDTLDITGQVLTETKAEISAGMVEAVLQQFRGEIKQIPPMYSAISKDGVRLYELARQGIEVEREARAVFISSLALLSAGKNEFSIDVRCSKGTYIRSLIDDIGKALGCGAVMTALERTEGNGFSLEDCVSLDAFMESDGVGYHNPPDRALQPYSQITVTPAQTTRFLNGGELDMGRITLPGNHTNYIRVYGNDRFLGLGQIDRANQMLKVKCVFNEA